MKKLMIVFALLIFAVNLSAQEIDTVVTKVGKYTITKIGPKENNKKEGIWRVYVNGKLEEIITYSRGIRHGLFVQYWGSPNIPAGKISTKGQYKWGEKDGVWFDYTTDYEKTCKYTYNYGVLEEAIFCYRDAYRPMLIKNNKCTFKYK